ncbi:MAG: type II toxin-antitoxin system MqsA family antitoxin [Myxococcales bacterium]|nr:type II toxin-antitoxin system MqsA family antitoxin [Myxococcales bacterium]
MQCDICGQHTARTRRVTRCFGEGASTFLIEEVPLVTCASCGEGYLAAETLREIERIRAKWRELSVEKSMPVVRFGDAP